MSSACNNVVTTTVLSKEPAHGRDSKNGLVDGIVRVKGVSLVPTGNANCPSIWLFLRVASSTQ